MAQPCCWCGCCYGCRWRFFRLHTALTAINTVRDANKLAPNELGRLAAGRAKRKTRNELYWVLRSQPSTAIALHQSTLMNRVGSLPTEGVSYFDTPSSTGRNLKLRSINKFVSRRRVRNAAVIALRWMPRYISRTRSCCRRAGMSVALERSLNCRPATHTYVDITFAGRNRSGGRWGGRVLRWYSAFCSCDFLSPVHTSNNVQATLSNATSWTIISTMSKQIEHVQFVSTLSK